MSENAVGDVIAQPLQEISLENSTIELPTEEVPECSGESSKAKNNSLKRFFKLTQKRGNKKETEGSLSDDNQSAANSNIECNADDKLDEKGAHKRFSLRLGGLHRHMSSLNLERGTKSEIDACNGSNSKTTLRSSLSSYWSVMFKKNKKDKQQQQQQNGTESEFEEKIATTNLDTTVELNETNPPDTTDLNDEVHTLQISKEMN